MNNATPIQMFYKRFEDLEPGDLLETSKGELVEVVSRPVYTDNGQYLGTWTVDTDVEKVATANSRIRVLVAEEMT